MAGLSPAAAQFLPAPGQSAPAGQFPPVGNQRQSNPFPPPPGQTQAGSMRQDPAFPPAPAPGQAPAPAGFSPAPSGGFGGGGGGGFGGGGGGGGGPSEAQRVCLTFPAIRSDVEKEFALIKAAGERKASREEACPLFKNAVLKESKMVKFLETNRVLCGVPPQAIAQVKTNHAHTIRIRDQLCSAGPVGPAGPSLSDALGGPIIADDSTAKQPGTGTFNTLTGNVLAR